MVHENCRLVGIISESDILKNANYLIDVLAGVALSLVIAYIVYRYRRQLNAFADKIVSKIINLHLVQK